MRAAPHPTRMLRVHSPSQRAYQSGFVHRARGHGRSRLCPPTEMTAASSAAAIGRGYCPFGAMSSATARQRSVSAAISAAISCGVVPPGSTPILASFARNSGVFSAAMIGGRERVDDLLRRSLGRHQAVVGRDRGAGHGLGDGRHVGQMARALLAADAERLHLVGPRERLELDRARRQHLHLAADQIGEGRSEAAIGHVHHVEAGALEEQGDATCVMLAGRPTHRCSAGLLLHRGDEFGERRGGNPADRHHGVEATIETGAKSLG